MLSLKTSWLVCWHVRTWRDEKVWNVERYFAYVSVPAGDLVKLRDPIIFYFFIFFNMMLSALSSVVRQDEMLCLN